MQIHARKIAVETTTRAQYQILKVLALIIQVELFYLFYLLLKDQNDFVCTEVTSKYSVLIDSQRRLNFFSKSCPTIPCKNGGICRLNLNNLSSLCVNIKILGFFFNSQLKPGLRMKLRVLCYYINYVSF